MPTIYTNAGSQPLGVKLGEKPSVVDFASSGVDKTGVADSKAGLVIADASVAAIGGHLLFPAGTYLVNSDITMAAHCKFSPGAIIQPASGKTVTFSQPIEAGLYQIFDYSLGGTVQLNYTTPLYTEWWGAMADGSTDCKPAIDAALAQALPFVGPTGTVGPTVMLQQGNYQYHGKMTGLGGSNGLKLVGSGAQTTYLNGTDNTVTAVIETSGLNSFANLTIQGITIRGLGKTSGTNVHGLYVHPTSAPYGLALRDVRAMDLSGNGIYVVNAFDSKFYDVWVENIGGAYGIAIGGDQSTTFVNSGQFNENIGSNPGDPTGDPDAFSWWFMEGAPFLQGLNTGDTAQGMRLGSTVSDPRGIAFCQPTIIGLNIEGVEKVGGTGIQLESGSNFAFATGITMYAIGVAAGKGVHWKGAMNNAGLMCPAPAIVPGSGGGTWANLFYADGAGFPNQGMTLIIGGDQSAGFNSTITDGGLIQQIIPNTPSAGPPIGFKIGQQLLAPGWANQGGSEATNTQTVSASYSIGVLDRDVNVDASGGAKIITVPNAGSGVPGRLLTITKVDTSNNDVSLSCGQPIGGATNNVLTIPNQSVTIRANAAGTEWEILSQTLTPWVNQKYGNGTFAGLPTCPSSGNQQTLASLSPMYIDDSSTIIPGDAAAGGGASRVLVVANPFTGNWVVLVPLIH